MTALAELEQQLTKAKVELREQSEQRGLIDVAGPWAEQILGEALTALPDADAIDLVAHHEAGHYRMFQLLNLPVAAIRMQLFADGRLQGMACPDWNLINSQPTKTDAENMGARLQGCKSVGIQLDLDGLIEKAERMVRADWKQIQRIGQHVASVCRSQSGNEWRVIISADSIARLFWTADQWAEKYGEGILCAEY